MLGCDCSELYRSDSGVVGYYSDLDGNAVKRTPWTHPFSYDTFVVFKSREFKKTDIMVDTDPLRQWDWNAFSVAVHEVWPGKTGNQGFNTRNPEEINRFLCLYFKRDVKLTAVLQNCNQSNGNPYWTFAFVYQD